MAATTNKFPKKVRLRQRSEFLSFQREGRKVYARCLLLVIKDGKTGRSRIGITVTKKLIRNATLRNKLKRRVREIFRKAQNRLTGIYDILVIARQGAAQSSYAELEQLFLGALEQKGIVTSLKV